MFGLALKSAIRKKLLLRAVSLFENQFVCGKFSSEYFHCFGPCIRQKKNLFLLEYITRINAMYLFKSQYVKT